MATTAALTATALGLAIVGCGSATETESNGADATAVNGHLEPRNGNHQDTLRDYQGDYDDTLHDYIVEHGIEETPFNPGDPGTPDYDLPFPAGWSEATEIPDWAFGAIVYDDPADPAEPPAVTAIASKLTGDVEVPEVLEYSSGLLDSMPEFEPLGAPTVSAMSGFDSIQYAGTYLHDGERRFVAEIVVVVPGPDGLFVLQVDGTSIESESQTVVDAMEWIHEHATITP